MLEHEDSDEVYFSDEYLIKFDKFWVYEVSLHKLKWYVFTVVVRKKLMQTKFNQNYFLSRL